MELVDGSYYFFRLKHSGIPSRWEWSIGHCLIEDGVTMLYHIGHEKPYVLKPEDMLFYEFVEIEPPSAVEE